MPKIPQYQQQLRTNTSGVSGFSTRGPSSGITSFGANEARSIGQGIMDIAKGVHASAEYKRAFQERQEAQDNAKEIASFTSQMRLDWSRRMREHEENPHDDIAFQVGEEFEAYKTAAINNASSAEVSEALQLQLESYQVDLEEKASRLQQVTRAANFGAAFDEMFMNAQDAVFESKSIEEFQAQEQLIKDFVDVAVESGRIKDKSTANSLKAKADQLAYTWAMSTVNEQPEMVLQAIDEGLLNNVKPNQKQALVDKANRTIESAAEIDKVALRQDFQSDKVQRLNTGAGGTFNYDEAVEAFGKTTADQMQRELDTATELYTVNERIKGADGEALRKEIESAKPTEDPSSDLYAEQFQHFQNVQGLVTKAQQDKLADPYTYYSQDPAIAGLLEQLGEDPANLELNKQIQDLILEKQRSDKTLPISKYAVMSKSEAISFIDDFQNAVAVGSTEGQESVRNNLIAFEQRFAGNVSYALNQLFNTDGGSQVASQINPLMWQLTNPGVFRMVLDSTRKDDKEVMKQFPAEEKADFLDDVTLSSELISYRNSIISTDNSPLSNKIINGTSDVFRKFARDFVLNGGDVEEASTVFFDYYTFGELNNMTFARPRTYQGQDGQVHRADEDSAELSTAWLEVELQDLAYNKLDTLNPETLLPSTKFLNEEQVAEDMKDQILTNAFWSTSEDESGVYLFVKGAYPGTAVQVFDKENNPVYYPFNETYVGRHKLTQEGFGQSGGQPIPARTDDTWARRLSRTLTDL